jgi:uncharacterized protein YbjQ (UPF0145 family)
MSLIGALALVPAAAFADVDIDVDIEKDKTKVVYEKLVKFKAAVILVLVVKITDKAAESETLVNQTNKDNDQFNFFNTSISTANSVTGNGIVGVNQASGNMNNQANAVSVAVDGGNDHSRLFFGGSFAESQAASDQKNKSNFVLDKVSTSTSTLNSVSGNGIIGVNQASGSINNQANAVSVAVGVDPAVSLSEADLGQVNRWNSAVSIFSRSTSTIGSIGGNGIIGVNQASGHMNNQSNVVSVAATR